MKDSILTIAIPTYNRPLQLQKQIRSIIPLLTDEVELLVIDNCGNYDIHTLFEPNELSCFGIVTNKFNIGGSSNIAKCFELCKSKWLWTLSDDDEITDNSIEIILNDIKDNPEAYYINYNNLTDYKACTLNDFCKSYTDYQKLFWMSVCIYNVDALMPYMYYYHRALSTMQAGIVLLVRALSDNQKFYVLGSTKTIIKNGDDNISWNRESFVYASLLELDLLRDLTPVLKGTLFHSLVAMLYYCVRVIFTSTREYIKSMELCLAIMKRRGLYYSLKYDSLSILKTIVCIFFRGSVK